MFSTKKGMTSLFENSFDNYDEDKINKYRWISFELNKTWWYDLNLLFIITCVLSFFLFISLWRRILCSMRKISSGNKHALLKNDKRRNSSVLFSKHLWRIIELEEKIFFGRWKIAFSLSLARSSHSKNDNVEIDLIGSIISQFYSFSLMFTLYINDR